MAVRCDGDGVSLGLRSSLYRDGTPKNAHPWAIVFALEVVVVVVGWGCLMARSMNRDWGCIHIRCNINNDDDKLN